MKNKAPSIFIAIPSGDSVSGDFWLSFTFLIMRIQQLMNGGIISRFEISNRRSADLADSREKLTRQAIDSGFSHILWIDSDMTFPSWIAERLLKLGKDIVGASYAQRAHAQNLPNTFVLMNGNLSPCWPLNGKEPIEIDAIGYGLLLVKTDVYKKISEPWFLFEYIGNGNYLSEDLRFCREAKANGFKIYADPISSRYSGHSGYHTYGFMSIDGRNPTRMESLIRQQTSLKKAEEESP